MKKTIYLMFALLLLSATSMKAQVAISTNNPDLEPRTGAILDLSQVPGKNLGLLLPRVELDNATDKEHIAGKDPADGLMVYNLGTEGLDEGVYVWYDNSWNRMGQAKVDQLAITPTQWTFPSVETGYSIAPSKVFTVVNMTNAPLPVPVSVPEWADVSDNAITIPALGSKEITVTAKLNLEAQTYNGVLKVGDGANVRTAAISLTVEKLDPNLQFTGFRRAVYNKAAYAPPVTTVSDGELTFTVVNGTNVFTDNTLVWHNADAPTQATIRVTVAETTTYRGDTKEATMDIVYCESGLESVYQNVYYDAEDKPQLMFESDNVTPIMKAVCWDTKDVVDVLATEADTWCATRGGFGVSFRTPTWIEHQTMYNQKLYENPIYNIKTGANDWYWINGAPFGVALFRYSDGSENPWIAGNATGLCRCVRDISLSIVGE